MFLQALEIPQVGNWKFFEKKIRCRTKCGRKPSGALGNSGPPGDLPRKV